MHKQSQNWSGVQYSLKEHKSESQHRALKLYGHRKIEKKAFTRFQRKASVTGEQTKSTITDHVKDTNHVLCWENTAIKNREQNRLKRHIKGIHLNDETRTQFLR